MAPRIAEVEIDYAAPNTPKPTIDVALSAVYTLCSRVEHGNASYVELYHRFDLLYKKLAEDDADGKVRNDLFDDYATAIEEFWRLLVVYDGMTFVERLLTLQDTRANLVRVNEQVEELLDKAGLKPDLKDDWAKLNHEDTRTQRLALEALATNASAVINELRGVRQKQDAIVLLKAEMNKKESKLPTGSRAAVNAAYFTLAGVVSGAPQQTPLWFTMPSEITYKVKPFGQGSFASVHHGTFRNHEKVVVKFVRVSDGALEQATQNALRAEADQLFALRHDNIVNILGANHVCSVPFIVMEHAEHGTMIDYLARGNKNKMWQLFYEGAQGIEYLHSKRVVHADLKLNNILISSDGKARIADFGLSQVKRRYESKSRSMTKLKNGAEVYGALRWRAPEHVTHEPQYASDVYSYAMCIIEAFTGEAPYGTDDDQEVKRKIVEHIIPPRPEGLSDEVWGLVEQMTKPEPKERITMPVVVTTLKKFAADEANAAVKRQVCCAKCSKSQPENAKFCSECGTRNPPPKTLAKELVQSIKSSTGESQTLEAQKLFRQLQAASEALPSEEAETLVSVATSSSNWLTALYVYGCLLTLGGDIDKDLQLNMQSAQDAVDEFVCDNLSEFDTAEAFAAVVDQVGGGPYTVAELTDLLVHLNEKNKNSLRHQVPVLATTISTATGDEAQCQRSAALSALVLLVQREETSSDQEAVRLEGIGSVLVSMLHKSQDDRDKINAALLLGDIAEVAQECTTASDIDDILLVLRKGGPQLKESLVRAIGHIAKSSVGAQLVGRRGGMAALMDLFVAADNNDNLKRTVLETLAELVKDAYNGSVFSQEHGLAGIEASLSNSPTTEDTKALLSVLTRMVSTNNNIGQAVASNKSILSVCLNHLEESAMLCYELVKRHRQAVHVLDDLGGFERLARVASQNPFAKDTIVRAIKAALGKSEASSVGQPNLKTAVSTPDPRSDGQPEGEPKAEE